MTRLWILGSGSGGNAIYLSFANARILIDIGFSPRQLSQRLEQIGVDPAQIDAVLISHEHTDHIKGLKFLKYHPKVFCYTNRLTAEAIEKATGSLPHNLRLFSNGDPFSIADVTINPFSVLHDAIDPVGFEILCNGLKVAVATDLGFITGLIRERMKDCDCVIIEANHDENLLKNTTHRPWSLKQRILGKTGHLSNESAGKLLAEIAHERLAKVVLAHISRDCNTPDLARSAAEKHLRKAGMSHIPIIVAKQHEVSEKIELS
ncbi:MBL fold metallo-hydrolase [bacterium]|nr:MBL fold metallo-hydrolase [bacterium]